MLSGPIVAMVWEGRDAVKTGRSRHLPEAQLSNAALINAQRSLVPPILWLRHQELSVVTLQLLVSSLNNLCSLALINCQDVGRNVCHGSDAVDSAKKEIALWFTKEEILSWQSTAKDWIYEKP